MRALFSIFLLLFSVFSGWAQTNIITKGCEFFSPLDNINRDYNNLDFIALETARISEGKTLEKKGKSLFVGIKW